MPLRTKLKNFLMQYSEVQVKVREATSNDPWGTSGSLMAEIAKMSYHTDSLSEIMQVLGQRLNDSRKNWRHVYKSLVLLDYLIKNGSRQVIVYCHEKAYDIWLLKDFTYVDKAGKDQGFHVRQQSRHILDLLRDGRRLKLEREKAQRIQFRMFFPASQNMYKLRPTAPDIGSVIEKQQAQHIKKPSIDSPSCTVEKISSSQPVQDLMICDDKAQLLHASSEDQRAAPVPLDVVVSPPDPLKAGMIICRVQSSPRVRLEYIGGLKSTNFNEIEPQPGIPKNQKDTGERKQQAISSNMLNPSFRLVSENTISHSTKKKSDCKEYRRDKSQKLPTNMWDVKNPVTSPIQDNITWADVLPTLVASLSMSAQNGFYPQQKDISVTDSNSVPAPRGSSSSQFTINTSITSKTKIPNKSIKMCLACPKLPAIVPEASLKKCIQPVMNTGPLSVVQHRPYQSTNPFFNSVTPTIAERGQAALAVQSIENISSFPRTSQLGLFRYGLYPPTSLFNVTPSPIQASNPHITWLYTGVSSMDLTSPTFVVPVFPRYPTNPFL
ncbi:ENTH domain-containing protein 1 [Hyla sarda]|uniref:ENTH domain-containing protein 1 n=1 Tax=Hyla sarda TaxID=327740 RepID=UPI0024C2F962|nr:ENTH domain-containing protein 1 [Hyla sarda]